MKQIIIVRKDLHMTPGELASQTAQAGSAYFIHAIVGKAKRHLIVECGVAEDRYAKQVDGSLDSIWMDRPAEYRNHELNRMAKEAFERGEKSFYYRKKPGVSSDSEEYEPCGPEYDYISDFRMEEKEYDSLAGDDFARIICEARSLEKLMSAAKLAEEEGLKENEDFFLIRDREAGITCIGFRPMEDKKADRIGKRFGLYRNREKKSLLTYKKDTGAVCCGKCGEALGYCEPELIRQTIEEICYCPNCGARLFVKNRKDEV